MDEVKDLGAPEGIVLGEIVDIVTDDFNVACIHVILCDVERKISPYRHAADEDSGKAAQESPRAQEQPQQGAQAIGQQDRAESQPCRNEPRMPIGMKKAAVAGDAQQKKNANVDAEEYQAEQAAYSMMVMGRCTHLFPEKFFFFVSRKALVSGAFDFFQYVVQLFNGNLIARRLALVLRLSL